MREGEADTDQDINGNDQLVAGLAKYRDQSKLFRHLSLMESSNTYDWTPRIWNFVAKHDSFEANEMASSYRLPDVTNPMPFLQEELYDCDLQPGNLSLVLRKQ